MPASERFQQLALRFTDPVQFWYKVIRGSLVADETIAERGLSRKRVLVWLYDGRLRIAHRQALLAQYTYRAERRGTRLRAVDPHPQLYRTAYASPQLELWELDDAQWRKVWERPS